MMSSRPSPSKSATLTPECASRNSKKTSVLPVMKTGFVLPPTFSNQNTRPCWEPQKRSRSPSESMSARSNCEVETWISAPFALSRTASSSLIFWMLDIGSDVLVELEHAVALAR